MSVLLRRGHPTAPCHYDALVELSSCVEGVGRRVHRRHGVGEQRQCVRAGVVRNHFGQLDQAGTGTSAAPVTPGGQERDLDGDIVGRTSVRHTLNDFLLHEGGHIGYCVLPPYRRRGYATTILQRSLVLTRQLGVERALVTCNDGNVGSVAVIVACGGQLESTVDGADGNRKRRYWIG